MAAAISNRRLRNGPILIVTYFAITYWLPVIGNEVLGESITSSYRIYPLTDRTLVEIVAVFVVWVGLERVRLRIPTWRVGVLPWLVRTGRLYRRFRPVFAVGALVLGLAGLLTGLSAWRYGASITSGSSPLLIPLIVLNELVMLDLFCGMFVEPPLLRRRSRMTRFADRLLAVFLLVTANGVLSVFFGLAALVWSLFPMAFRRFVFVPSASYRIERVIRGVFAVALLVVAFAAAWVVGNVIKSSVNLDLRAIRDNPAVLFENVFTGDSALTSTAAYVVERQSIHYYSLLFTTAVPRSVLEPEGRSPLSYPLRTAAWRFDYVLGAPAGLSRPPITSMMQLNYQLLTLPPVNDRSGTSPGLLAAFDYIFPPVLAVLLAALYVRWLTPKLGILLYQPGAECLSPIGALLAVQFVGVMFQSPFDLLMIVDDGFIWFALLLIVAAAKARRIRRIHRRSLAALAQLPPAIVDSPTA